MSGCRSSLARTEAAAMGGLSPRRDNFRRPGACALGAPCLTPTPGSVLTINRADHTVSSSGTDVPEYETRQCNPFATIKLLPPCWKAERADIDTLGNLSRAHGRR